MLPDERMLRVGVAAEILRDRVSFFGRLALLSNRPTYFHREKIDEIMDEIHMFRRSARRK